MRIWHISDTHGFHDWVDVPDNIDLVIHTGDASNYRDPYRNEHEFRKFLTWFDELPIENKVYVAGNHDSAIEKGLITKDNFDMLMIHYIENTWKEVCGLKIWGSPTCPTYGNWCFMKARHKLYQLWENIPEDTDILITHTPPKGILDYSYNINNTVERCGCSALKNRVLKVNPRAHLFGHIHNCKDIINAGILKLNKHETIFSNGTIVTDGRFGEPDYINNGNIIEL